MDWTLSKKNATITNNAFTLNKTEYIQTLSKQQAEKLST